MINILAVGLGGFIGSIFRYLLGLFVHSICRQSEFPYGTLSANVLGCLIIGILSGLVDDRIALSATTRLFLFTGILGGFTTFSTFSLDTLTLFQGDSSGGLLSALFYVVAHVVLGLIAVSFGHWLAQLF